MVVSVVLYIIFENQVLRNQFSGDEMKKKRIPIFIMFAAIPQVLPYFVTKKADVSQAPFEPDVEALSQASVVSGASLLSDF